MRRGGALLHRVIGAIVAIVVIAVVAVGVTVGTTTRVSEPRQRTHVKPAVAQPSAVEVAALRRTLRAGLTFSPAPGATGAAPDAPVTVKVATGALHSVRVTSPTGVEVPGTYVGSANE